MGEKNFKVWLSEKDFIIVFMFTVKGRVKKYLVKYITQFEGKEIEVARFDSGHQNIYVDILKPNGEKDRIGTFPLISENKIVDFAISEFREHYRQYRRRMIEWLKK